MNYFSAFQFSFAFVFAFAKDGFRLSAINRTLVLYIHDDGKRFWKLIGGAMNVR
jgi:hypothetical protein